MKRLFITLCALLSLSALFSQTTGISVNETGSDPDSSAIFDIQSQSKGLLIPRMSSTQRLAINGAATGLLVFDLTTESFWYFDGSAWVEMMYGLGNTFADADGDTRVEVESTTDADSIQFMVKGKESMIITDNGIFANGSISSDSEIPYSGPGARFMWVSGLSALRIGEAVGTEWDATNLRYNSSILGGKGNEISGGGQGATIGGGFNNLITGGASFVGAGQANTISGIESAIVAGFRNEAPGEESFIGAGRDNKATGFHSGVVAGQDNESNGTSSVVVAGKSNFTDGIFSAILGGEANQVFGIQGAIGGGFNNIILGNAGFVGGGKINIVTGLHSSIVSGFGNAAQGKNSFVAGGSQNFAEADYASILGGNHLEAESFGETVVGQYNVRSGGNDTAWVGTQPLFVVGNGTSQTNRSNAFTILKNGRVGIGTSTPGPPLHLVANTPSTVGAMVIQNTNTTGFAGTYYHDQNNVRKGYIGWVNATSNLLGPGTLQLGAGGAAIYLNPSTGRVGVGVADPVAKFHVNGDSRFSGNGIFGTKVGIGTASPSVSLDVNGDAHFAGNVGIGTSSPTRGLLEVDGSADYVLGTAFGFLNSLGNTGSNTITSPSPFSIYASHLISGSGFRAHSDARIKNIEGISDGTVDLSTLMKIEVTDYRMRDSISNWNAPIKKVIAQQVAEVYPQAVTSDLTEVVPDIYQRANLQDGWIMLATDLQAGERVKLITEETSEVFEVTAVEENRFQVALLGSDTESISAHGTQVFVYGREVDDFHTVDYEALSMLNVSATQEQQRLIEALQQQIETLEAEKALQQTRIEELQTNNDSFEARLQRLERSISDPR